MLISLSSFSQTDIKIHQVPNNDTVKLHKEVAKKVAKDLVYLDAIKSERAILIENIDSLKSIKNYKDSIIAHKDKQITYYRDIINIQEDKEKVYINNISAISLELKKQKLANKIIYGFLALSVGLLIVK